MNYNTSHQDTFYELSANTLHEVCQHNALQFIHVPGSCIFKDKIYLKEYTMCIITGQQLH